MNANEFCTCVGLGMAGIGRTWHIYRHLCYIMAGRHTYKACGSSACPSSFLPCCCWPPQIRESALSFACPCPCPCLFFWNAVPSEEKMPPAPCLSSTPACLKLSCLFLSCSCPFPLSPSTAWNALNGASTVFQECTPSSCLRPKTVDIKPYYYCTVRNLLPVSSSGMGIRGGTACFLPRSSESCIFFHHQT